MMIRFLTKWFSKLWRWFSRLLRKVFRKRRKPDLGPLFERDLPMGDEGWKLDKDSAPPLFPDAGPFALASLFRDPHPNTMPIQLGVAKKLFELMGAWYITRRLRVILTKRDAFQGISIFLSHLRLDFQDLLRSPKARERFNRYLDILMEVDEVCLEINVSDLPIYDALKSGNIENAEATLDLLHTARRVHAAIVNEKAIIFPGFRDQFVSPAIKKIAYWERLDESTLTELEEILHLWQSLQEQYDEITEALRAIIEQINGIDPKERRIRRAFHQIVKRVDGIRKEIEEGSKDAADGIEELQSCYDELAAIHEHIKDGTAHEESAHEREDDETSLDGKIRDCLKTLGLSGSGRVTLQILKTATRKLRRRYHPDRNPAPDATEKTQAINDAYKFLNDCLSRGVELHG